MFAFLGILIVGCGVTDQLANQLANQTGQVLPPDLTAINFQVNGSSETVNVDNTGERINLSVTVRNQGNGISSAGVVRYYLSDDSIIGTNDIEVGTDSFNALSINASSIEETSTEAPNTPGAYYYGACIDIQNGEGDTEDNCSTAVRVNVLTSDLTTINFQVNGSTQTLLIDNTGESIDMNVTITNAGTGSSSAGVVKYYRSDDSSITPSDTELGMSSFNALATNETAEAQVTLTAPTIPGAYYYGACVEGQSGESNVDNNCSSPVRVNVLASDLMITNFQINNSTATVNVDNTGTETNIDLKVTVRNGGPGSSSAGVVKYYRSDDNIISTNDIELGINSFNVLADTGSSNGEISIEIPNTPGTYYYGACVEVQPNESNVDNNCSSPVELNVLAADLSAINFQVNNSTTAVNVDNTGTETNIDLKVTVRNGGPGSGSAGVVKYYRSDDNIISTSDTEVGEIISTNILAANATLDELLTLTAPTNTGTYYYGACVEVQPNESNVDNNCSSPVELNVLAADLSAINFQVNNSTTTVNIDNTGTETNIDLKVTVRNDGPGSGSAGVVKYYLSDDNIINTSDTEVGEIISTNILAANATLDELLTLTAPTNTGTYYYGACVEVQPNESNVDNNCSSPVELNVLAADLSAINFQVNNSTTTVNIDNTGTETNIDLKVTVRNDGPGSGSAGVVKYYLSDDNIINTSDTEVGEIISTNILAANATLDELLTLTAPTNTGTYYYGACVEVQPNESNVDNNCSSPVELNVLAADLSAINFQVNNSTTAVNVDNTEVNIDLKVTVGNGGPGSGSAGVVKYYLSDDNIINTSDTEVGEIISTNILAANTTLDELLTLTAPTNTGTYYYGACVEVQPNESNVDNNCSTSPVRVNVLGSDLSAINFQVNNDIVTIDAYTGISIDLGVTVRNGGPGSGSAGVVKYYRSSNNTISTADTEVGSSSFTNILAANATLDEKIAVNTPPTDGVYYYGACVVGQANESNIANNCSRAVRVDVLSSGDRIPSLDIDTLTAAGNNSPTGIWSDGTNMWVADVTDDKIYAYNLNTKLRDPSKDFNGLNSARNNDPRGIWSDGTTMWVTDSSDYKIYAYNLASKSRDNSKDFNTLNSARNNDPRGIWSDGTTMWVINSSDYKIYAYNLASKSRDNSKDFNTLNSAGNNSPTGIWSDGTTMWVTDSSDDKIYAYKISDKTRDPDKDFNGLTAAGNTDPYGIWSDGTTMWVTDIGDDKIYAYVNRSLSLNNSGAAPDLVAEDFTVNDNDRSLSVGIRTSINLKVAVRNRGSDLSSSSGTVKYYRSTDSTITTSDTELGSDNFRNYLPINGTSHEEISLTVSPELPGTYYYGACVVVQNDESNTANNCTISPVRVNVLGSDLSAINFQVNSGTSRVNVYNTTTRVNLGITVRNSGFGSSLAGVVKYYQSTNSTITTNDLEVARDSFNALAINQNSTLAETIDAPKTFGVYYYGACVEGQSSETDTSNNCSDAVIVEVVTFGSQIPSLDIDTLTAAGNNSPTGIWSDGTNMWVADVTDDKIYAYNLNTKLRDPSKDFNGLNSARNNDPRGIWSDGTTMWVTDSSDYKIYAYNLASKSRDNSKDFNTLNSARNNDPRGIWSDGTTMWVINSSDYKIYAYNLASKSRDNSKDFNTLNSAGNNSPTGIWSDGTTMWVTDSSDDKIYAYKISDKTRDPDKDFNGLTAAGNTDPYGIWSDGTTMWVTDIGDDKIYAYVNRSLSLNNSGAAPDLVAEDFTVNDNDRSLSVGIRTSINLKVAVRNRGSDLSSSSGTVKYYRSTDSTITTSDTELGSDNFRNYLPINGTSHEEISLTVSPELPGTYYYGACVVVQNDESNTANNCTISPVRVNVLGSDLSAINFQVNSGTSRVNVYNTTTRVNLGITVRNSGFGSSLAGVVKYYQSTNSTITTNDLEVARDSFNALAINQNSTLAETIDAPKTFGVYYYGACVEGQSSETDTSNNCSDAVIVEVVTFGSQIPSLDIDTLTAAGNNSPTGIWSDGTNMWVADVTDDKIYAYNLNTKLRDPSKDFNGLNSARNNDPRGIWSDGTTMWVTDSSDYKIYAYNLASKSRDNSKDFNTLNSARNNDPRGIWSDGTTMWVINSSDYKIYAYNLASKSRDNSKDFNTLNSAGNNSPTGIWSDGTTMWVTDSSDDKIYAYKISDKTRDPDKDFNGLTAAGNTDPYGIWSDGTTMWVTDIGDDKIYAYRIR